METNKPEVILIAPGAGIDTRLLMTELKQHNVTVIIADEIPVMILRPRHTVPELAQITACEYNPKRDKHSNQTWKKPWKR